MFNINLNISITSIERARGPVVRRLPHAEKIIGSIPVGPIKPFLFFCKFTKKRKNPWEKSSYLHRSYAFI